MAQPPLSQQIRLLEQELNLELFDRTTRSVTLTEAGDLLLEEAQGLLANAAGVERVMSEFRAGESGTLRLGFVDSSAYEVMPRFLREYRARWPLVQFELRSMSSDQQHAALIEGEIDLGIARAMGAGRQIGSTLFLNEKLFVAVPSTHRLAKLASTQLGQLHDERFIGFDRRISPTHHAQLMTMFAASGIAYDTLYEATEYTSILGLVAAGEGIAVVPASVRSFQPAELRFVRLRDPGAIVSLLMLYRTGHSSRLIDQGLDLVAELFHQPQTLR